MKKNWNLIIDKRFPKPRKHILIWEVGAEIPELGYLIGDGPFGKEFCVFYAPNFKLPSVIEERVILETDIYCWQYFEIPEEC